MWAELMRLSVEQPAPWTLIGAHMVALRLDSRAQTKRMSPSREGLILLIGTFLVCQAVAGRGLVAKGTVSFRRSRSQR